MAAVDDLLDDSVELDDFLTWSEWALARVGFRPSNCLALVAVCRDELMSSFDDRVARVWGRPFEIGALGGMVLVGSTGIRAALSHVPGEDGRHRLVVFCFPHIGVDGDRVGRVRRRGMSRASIACGAVDAVRGLLPVVGSPADVVVDPDDVEQSLLRSRLIATAGPDACPSLLELTEMVRSAAVEDVRRYLDLARHDEPVDVACLSGILVHAPGGEDRVAEVLADVTIDGVRMELPH